MIFGERAAELAGLVSVLLGWRPDEFWNATPCELASALRDGATDHEQVDGLLIERLQAMYPDERN